MVSYIPVLLFTRWNRVLMQYTTWGCGGVHTTWGCGGVCTTEVLMQYKTWGCGGAESLWYALHASQCRRNCWSEEIRKACSNSLCFLASHDPATSMYVIAFHDKCAVRFCFNFLVKVKKIKKPLPEWIEVGDCFYNMNPWPLRVSC